jgi:hypothetical protein
LRKKPWPTPLTITPPPASTPPEPPRELSGPGRDVWNRLVSEYDIRDCAGQELLQQICEAINRLQSLTEQIRKDGELIADGKGGRRSHPLLRDEIMNRGYISKALKYLGVIDQPGRSSRSFG